jgi:cytoskeleton protein RodZ
VPELQSSTEITLPAAADVAVLVAPADLTVPATPNDAPAVALPEVTAPAIPVTTAEIIPETSPALGLAKLEFNASQETWVGIIDAEGKLIYDKIIFAGSRESIQAKLPLNVTVGNAGATSLNMNGKTVELAPHTRNNVARIKLE